MFCSHCGTQVNESARFCSNCGSTIQPSQNNARKVSHQSTIPQGKEISYLSISRGILVNRSMEITNYAVTIGNKRFPINIITGFSYWAKQEIINQIPTPTNYSIVMKIETPEGKEKNVLCLGGMARESTYVGFIHTFLKVVGPHIVAKMLDKLANGEGVKFGPVELFNHGIVLSRWKIISPEKKFFHWEDVNANFYGRKIIITSLSNKKFETTVELFKVFNFDFLKFLLKTILKKKYTCRLITEAIQ